MGTVRLGVTGEAGGGWTPACAPCCYHMALVRHLGRSHVTPRQPIWSQLVSQAHSPSLLAFPGEPAAKHPPPAPPASGLLQPAASPLPCSVAHPQQDLQTEDSTASGTVLALHSISVMQASGHSPWCPKPFSQWTAARRGPGMSPLSSHAALAENQNKTLQRPESLGPNLNAVSSSGEKHRDWAWHQIWDNLRRGGQETAWLTQASGWEQADRLTRGSRWGPGSEENQAQRAVSAREGRCRARGSRLRARKTVVCQQGLSHRPGKGQPSPPQIRTLSRHVLLQPSLHVPSGSIVWTPQTASTHPDPVQPVPHSCPRAPTSPGFRLTHGHSSSLLFHLDFFLSDVSFSGAPRLSLQASPWILNPSRISIYVVSSLATRIVPRTLIPSHPRPHTADLQICTWTSLPGANCLLDIPSEHLSFNTSGPKLTF